MTGESKATFSFDCSRCGGVNVERPLSLSDDLIVGTYRPVVYSCAWCKKDYISHVTRK